MFKYFILKFIAIFLPFKLNCLSLGIHAYNGISCTDISCIWKRPAASIIQETRTQEDLFPKKFKPVLSREVEPQEVDDFLKDLEGETTGLSWILKADKGSTSHQSKISSVLLNVEDLMLEAEFVNGSIDDRKSFLSRMLVLNDEQIHSIAEQTVGQNKCIDWFTARKHRLTASNFGKILAAVNRNKFPKTLWETLLGKYFCYYYNYEVMFSIINIKTFL